LTFFWRIINEFQRIWVQNKVGSIIGVVIEGYCKHYRKTYNYATSKLAARAKYENFVTAYSNASIYYENKVMVEDSSQYKWERFQQLAFPKMCLK